MTRAPGRSRGCVVVRGVAGCWAWEWILGFEEVYVFFFGGRGGLFVVLNGVWIIWCAEVEIVSLRSGGTCVVHLLSFDLGVSFSITKKSLA